MSSPTILLTGATGYIGSHTWLSLLNDGYQVVGVDNFSNSSPEVLNRLSRLSGQNINFMKLDVRDGPALDSVFARHHIAAAVHFAAYKAVGESTQRPLDYYDNNIGGLLSLCQALTRHNCPRLVFSSSATVYGVPKELPLREDAALGTQSPYGATKLMSENILRDLVVANPQWAVAILRYFNPVGAHESGQLGEDPRGIPNNLMPYVTQVAVGQRAKLQVFGNDYNTPDGTGVRDYIHVQDLALGHRLALAYLLEGKGNLTVNLGTGQGYSVLDLVSAFEKASGRPIPFDIVGRRPGDVDACYADPSRAEALLGWRATRHLDEMCTDSWRWQSMNPKGYGE